MKNLLKFMALVAAVSAVVVVVIAYKDEIADFIDRCLYKFRRICPEYDDSCCFADVEE